MPRRLHCSIYGQRPRIVIDLRTSRARPDRSQGCGEFAQQLRLVTRIPRLAADVQEQLHVQLGTLAHALRERAEYGRSFLDDVAADENGALGVREELLDDHRGVAA